MSQSGVASRRKADEMIEQGRVRVNQKVVRKLGMKIDDKKDQVIADGKIVEKEKKRITIMVNKPSGYLVSLKDPFKKPLIRDLLPSIKERIFPVGRLDYDSEGLLLMTNDGELAYRLTHPSFQITKTYLIKVKGNPNHLDLKKLEKGVMIDGEKTAPAKIILIKKDGKKALLRVEIREGKKREIRRMFEVIGSKVIELERIAFGGLKLGNLEKGSWRYLKIKEIEYLKKRWE